MFPIFLFCIVMWVLHFVLSSKKEEPVSLSAESESAPTQELPRPSQGEIDSFKSLSESPKNLLVLGGPEFNRDWNTIYAMDASASEALRLGNFNAAIEIYRGIIEYGELKKHLVCRWHEKLGDTYQKVQNYSDSVVHYKKAQDHHDAWCEKHKKSIPDSAKDAKKASRRLQRKIDKIEAGIRGEVA